MFFIGSCRGTPGPRRALTRKIPVEVLETFSPDAVAALLRTRRTIHRFDPVRPVPMPLIESALATATFAPNHRTTEPWRFYTFGPSARERLIALNSEIVRARQGAAAAEDKRRRWQEIPGFVAFTCQRSGDAFREEEDFAACACAVHNFSLHLWSAGVGTKWTTGAVTRDARFFDLLTADPDHERLVGLIQYGFPADVPEGRRQPASQFTVHLP